MGSFDASNLMPASAWFSIPEFYTVGVTYMCTRLVVNVSQVYVSFEPKRETTVQYSTVLYSNRKTKRDSQRQHLHVHVTALLPARVKIAPDVRY